MSSQPSQPSKPAESAPPPAAPAHAHHDRPQDDTIKETFESIIIAFILAFVFRAYVVEAFVIPTGSMAPTLLGEHLRVDCSQCGYHFKVETPGDEKSGAVSGRRTAIDLGYSCPMCQYENLLPRGTNVSSGDRILVHKYLYSMSEPKRWDVVVFKAPHKPNINYIKRLVGLPNQDTLILEGNVYFNPDQGNESGWRIARKTDPKENPHAFKIQRAVWQPIYHSEFTPLDYDPSDSNNRWRSPWVISDRSDPHAAAWKRGNATANDAELDPREGFAFNSDKQGSIRFSFPRVFLAGNAGLFPYGQRGMTSNPHEDTRRTLGIEDIRLAAAVQAWQPGLNLKLQTTTRMDDPKGITHTLTAMIDANGQATLNRSDQDKPIASTNVGTFVSGKTRLIELWYVDQEASLWIDGDRVLVAQFDAIDYVDLLKRPLPFTEYESEEMRREHESVNKSERHVQLNMPVVKIEVQGSPVTLHRIELDRDLHYISKGRGTYDKPYDLSTAYGSAVHLEADEFYCLGDNGPSSADGRIWDSTDPWVLRNSFAPDTDDRHSHGLVPRRLMMGKAFFVYFPTLISPTPGGTPFVPNFGEMRFIK